MEEDGELRASNELIAKFMGWKKTYNEIEVPKEFDFQRDQKYGYWTSLFEWNLGFHKSWDWLMPVVQKISSLMPEIKIPEHLEALKNGTHGSEEHIDVITLPVSAPIDEVYKKVVHFIKWHNETLNQK